MLGVLSCETCDSVSFVSPAVERWNLIANAGQEIGAGATQIGASPQVTVSASLGSSDHWAMGGIAIKPSGAGGAIPTPTSTATVTATFTPTATYSDSYAYDIYGRLSQKGGSTYTYSSTHPHAASQAHGWTYSYSDNGDVTSKTDGVDSYDFGYTRELKVSTISLTFPANFQLVTAMNPCPCGYYGDPLKPCTCLSSLVTKYQKRIPDIAAVLDYYVEQLEAGYRLVYTPVDFFDLPDELLMRVRRAMHHTARAMKRVTLKIPTPRGSNYAVNRALFLELYETGRLRDDIQLGPNIKAIGCKHRYGAARELTVLTSGRRIGRSWLRIFRYIYRRLLFNLRYIRDTEAARSIKKVS